MRVYARSTTVLVVVLLLGLTSPATPITPAAPLLSPAPKNQSVVPTPAQGCCKVCRKGKACGDTCISRNYECHVGPGCACNG